MPGSPSGLLALGLLTFMATLFATACLALPAAAATVIPAGTLWANETWTIAGSPYLLQGDVVVAPGVRLQITAGTAIEESGSGFLVVEGQLDAVGSASSPIEFRPDANNTSWGGIAVVGAGGARIENATLTNPSVGIRINSSGALDLKDVRILGTAVTSVFLDGGSGPATLLNVSVGGGSAGFRTARHTGAARVDGLTADSVATCILINDTANVSLRNVRASNCQSDGMRLEGAVNLTAANVTLLSNGAGLNMSGSRGVHLSQLSVTAVNFCADLQNGADNWISGFTASTCDKALVTQGTEAGLRVDNLVALQGPGILLFGGTNLSIRDSTFAGSGLDGVSNRWVRPQPPSTPPRPPQEFWGTASLVTLTNVTIDGRTRAVVIQAATAWEFRALNASHAFNAALWIRNSANITVNGSKVTGTLEAVYAENVTGLRVETSTLVSTVGHGVFCTPCLNPVLRENIFTGNRVGIRMAGGSGGLVAWNLFLYNSQHASTNAAGHQWDDGAVGNLWDDYTGVDADANGIGDTAYPVLGGVAADRYPIARYQDGEPPVADAGPDFIVFEDQPVWFNGWRCSDNVAIRIYLWSGSDGTDNFAIEGYDAVTTFPTPGVFEVTLTVIDWGANRAQDTVRVYVIDRTAPVAQAGGNRTVDEDTLIFFDGSNSTDNDPTFPDNAVFEWTVSDVSGTRVVSGLHAPYTFAEPGHFQVKLVVRDAGGRSSQEKFWVTVSDRTPPSLGPMFPPDADEETPFRVYAAPSTDNDPLWPVGKTEWFQLFQGLQLLDYTPASPAVFNVSDPGVYTAWYFVSDAAGNVASADISFLVGDATPPDLGVLGDRSVELGEAVAFDLDGVTDNDPAFGQTARASWEIPVPSGRLVLEGRAINYTFPAKGRYLLWAEVSDQAGNAARKSFLVTVADTLPPVLTLAGPISVEAGDEAVYVAAASDPSGVGPIAWNVTGLSSARWGAILRYRFDVPGAYTLRVHVNDSLGHGSDSSLEVQVVDATAPRILLTCAPGRDCASPRLMAPETLSVVFIGEDAVAGVVVSWQWGDGENASGMLGAHLYATPGNYTVTVRAVDAAGNANQTTFVVQVDAAPGSGTPDNPGNTTPRETNGAGFPLVGVAAVAAAGAAAGLIIGFRWGRTRREPPARHR